MHSFFALQPKLRGEFLVSEPLARYTTLKIGGPADALYYPIDLEDLKVALQFCREHQIPYFVLGHGSNLLVHDRGVRGLVLRLTRGFQACHIVEEDPKTVTFFVEAGFSLPKLVELCKKQGFSGIESLYGIPGTVGGALAMNAGTREGEIGPLVLEIQTLDAKGPLKTWRQEQLKFTYRHLAIPKTEILLNAKIKLKRSDPQKVAAKIEPFQKKRLQTQPLDQPNAGSIFKNPPKNFAAALIDELGLKGVRVGGARISEKHANWIVNEGKATAHDVLVLIGLVRDKVKENTGIRLETEIKIVGGE